MKKGWQTKTLGEICDIERGGSPRPIQNFITNDPNGINWIKIGDATASGKYIYKTEEKIRPEGVKRSRMVYDGDFILSNSMSFGRPYIMRTTGCIHDGWLVLHQPKVDPDYLYYVLSSQIVFSQFDRLAAGSTVRNLNIGSAKSVVIPYPPLAEQQRIVGVLDKAFAGLATAQAHAEKNLQNARELYDSCIQVEIGEDVALGELVDIKTGKLDANAAVEDGEYPFFTCSRETYAINNYAFDCEAVLLAGNNAVGDFNVKHYVGKFNAYQRTYVITINSKRRAISRYLYFQLQKNLKKFKSQSVGTGTKFLKLGMIKDMVIPLPTISEQKRMVNQLDALASETQRLQKIYEQKLAALAELKKSLLQQAFSGEL
jgi:type I restriction enzyme S subunit